MPKTSKYIDDEEGDQDYTPSSKAQEDVEEFEEQSEEPESKKRKRNTFAAQETASSSSSGNFERDDEGNPYLTLTNKRRITVRKFPSGDAAVDIREVYLDKNTQKMRPGKGICLPMNQYLKLKELLPEIDNAIKSVTNK